MNTHVYQAIGLMSGTSCDGLDICSCTFSFDKSFGWQYEIGPATTIDYDPIVKTKLINAIGLSALELTKLDWELGYLFGKHAREFINKHKLKPDLVASHGHTIFHKPSEGYTLQIGKAEAIYGEINTPVIYDFRSLDVALGGQGAPLVPIGDKLLFNNFTFCLNLGGFSNVSFEHNQNRIAYDICAVNTVINHLTNRLDKEFDEDGNLARKGVIIPSLLKKLNQLKYYTQPAPKSLGIEWVKENIYPLLKVNENPTNLLRTYYEHIAEIIVNDLSAHVLSNTNNSVLVTGGGAKNTFLIELFKEKARQKCEFVVPEANLVDYKEALIFAFLGVLKIRNEENTLKSVTGACRNSCGGTIISG